MSQATIDASLTRKLTPDEQILLAARTTAHRYLANGGEPTHTLGTQAGQYRAALFVGPRATEFFGGVYTGPDIELCRFDAMDGVRFAHPDLARHLPGVIQVLQALA